MRRRVSFADAQGQGGAKSLAQARRALLASLQERREDLEQELLTRVLGIADPAGSDPAYQDGLRASIETALDYALEVIERGERRAAPPPPALLAQARTAARTGVGLDTVLRRYLAGYTMLADFIAREVRVPGLQGGFPLSDLLPGRAAVLDRLLASVSEEYQREAKHRPTSTEDRRAGRVKRLLAGELIDTSEFGYDFESINLGLVFSGAAAEQILRELVPTLDCRVLQVRHAEVSWVWLGSNRWMDPEELRRSLMARLPAGVAAGIGDPAEGLRGWRLSHRQAAAAIRVAEQGGGQVCRYADVALLAAALADELLTESLHRTYLAPLESGPDRGRAARETLRAYFATGGNISSTAASLGVNRHTVANRLRSYEEAIGKPLERCLAEVIVALRLDLLA